MSFWPPRIGGLTNKQQTKRGSIRPPEKDTEKTSDKSITIKTMADSSPAIAIGGEVKIRAFYRGTTRGDFHPKSFSNC